MTTCPHCGVGHIYPQSCESVAMHGERWREEWLECAHCGATWSTDGDVHLEMQTIGAFEGAPSGDGVNHLK